ncbi:MAG: ankyrin repeat domain-containing protein [Gemmatimonadota bacterium]|nr:ankyrin repeat domain-containing protein [Gemmatimonadota bacterium]
MSRPLPARPSLEHLRKEAKALLRALAAGDSGAAARFGPRRGARAPRRLSEAQLVIAREYGFRTWAQLKHHVRSLASDDPMIALSAAVRLGDAVRVRDVLHRFPGLPARLDEAMPDGAFGATALIAAAQQRNREMVDVLLDAGANPNQRTHWWAGSFGVLGDDAELNSHLIARGVVVDAYEAARLGMLDRLRELLAADPTVVHARFGDGKTALHVASTVEIAALLLDHGADIDAQDVDHESTPAQYLIGDHPDVARYLVERGCRTDILLAAALGDLDRVRAALDRDPESVRTMVSPRWFPMRNPQAGGTIYIWTLGNGLSAHDVARASAHDDVYRLLVERSPVDLRLAVACDAGDEAEVRRLLGGRGDASALLTEDTRERLVSTASRGNVRAAHLMLACGWPADVRDAKGVTPLHWAAWHGQAALVRELLDRGADREATESYFGGTPLGWAEHGADGSPMRADGDYVKTASLLAANR